MLGAHTTPCLSWRKHFTACGKAVLHHIQKHTTQTRRSLPGCKDCESLLHHIHLLFIRFCRECPRAVQQTELLYLSRGKDKEEEEVLPTSSQQG